MDTAGDLSGKAAAFVPLNGIMCTMCALAATAASGTASAVPILARSSTPVLPIWAIGACMGTVASILQNQLIAKHNPGLVVVLLNACTNLVAFTTGALVYGKWSTNAFLGAVLITIGIYFIRDSK